MHNSMSLRKPSRPPPPPPEPAPPIQDRGYINISDCHTGAPEPGPFRDALYGGGVPVPRPIGFKSHHKSRSLTDTYLDLDRASSKQHHGIDMGASSIVYNEVDVSKTEALIKCKAMREGIHHQRGSVSLTRIRPPAHALDL